MIQGAAEPVHNGITLAPGMRLDENNATLSLPPRSVLANPCPSEPDCGKSPDPDGGSQGPIRDCAHVE